MSSVEFPVEQGASFVRRPTHSYTEATTPAQVDEKLLDGCRMVLAA
jgi:hypothetical protein